MIWEVDHERSSGLTMTCIGYCWVVARECRLCRLRINRRMTVLLSTVFCRVTLCENFEQCCPFNLKPSSWNACPLRAVSVHYHSWAICFAFWLFSKCLWSVLVPASCRSEWPVPINEWNELWCQVRTWSISKQVDPLTMSTKRCTDCTALSKCHILLDCDVSGAVTVL